MDAREPDDFILVILIIMFSAVLVAIFYANYVWIYGVITYCKYTVHQDEPEFT